MMKFLIGQSMFWFKITIVFSDEKKSTINLMVISILTCVTKLSKIKYLTR